MRQAEPLAEHEGLAHSDHADAEDHVVADFCRLAGGRIAANFIRPDTMTQFTGLLKELACINIETRLLQTAVSDSLGMPSSRM